MGVRSARSALSARSARSARSALVAVMALALVGLAPTAAGAATRAPVRAVHHVTLTLVDHSRPTVDPAHGRSAPSRTLVTQVYIPKGKGSFPLVVMAHGNAGNPGKLTELLTTWAQAGYVVAAPTFPLTNDLTEIPTVIGDYVNQPGDVSFVIDQVLKRSKHHGSPLSGASTRATSGSPVTRSAAPPRTASASTRAAAIRGSTPSSRWTRSSCRSASTASRSGEAAAPDPHQGRSGRPVLVLGAGLRRRGAAEVPHDPDPGDPLRAVREHTEPPRPCGDGRDDGVLGWVPQGQLRRPAPSRDRRNAAGLSQVTAKLH